MHAKLSDVLPCNSVESGSVEKFWGVNEDLTRFSKGKPLTYLMYGNKKPVYLIRCTKPSIAYTPTETGCAHVGAGRGEGAYIAARPFTKVVT